MHAKEIAQVYANALWNKKDIAVIDKYVHQDVIIHSALGDFQGRQALKEVAKVWLDGFPDLFVEDTHMIAEHDLVSIQWKAKGTHRSEFKGLKATGNSIAYSGATVYRVNGDKVVEFWTYIDMQHLTNQLR